MRPSLSNDILGNNNNNSSSVFIELSQRIQQLSFSSFQMLALLWLSAKGFEHIRNLGRIHRRGRRATGGADFVAVLPRSGMPVAIQVRHWSSPIQRRAVDEMRGFMLRHGISAGVIVSNQRFYRQAGLSASDFPGSPIQLISGHDLASSLISLGLGFKTFEDGSLAIDAAFFRTLHLLGFASNMDETSVPARKGFPEKAFRILGDTTFEGVLDQKPRKNKLLIAGLLIGIAFIGICWWSLGGY